MNPLRHLVPLVAALWASNAGVAEGGSVVALTFTHSEYGGGRVYVPARIGNVLGTMRLDTGASTTRVQLAPWNKDLPVLGQSASTGASGQTIGCEDVEARNVEIKAVHGNNIGRAKYRIARCPAGAGEDLLGLDFFKGARFTLDFERAEMTFFGDAPTFGHPRPFRLLGPDRRLVGIELRAGGAALVGLFDTGAELSAVDQRFVDAHRKLFAPVKSKGAARDAAGRSFSHRLYRLKEIDLGEGRIVRGVYVLAYDFGALREALGAEAPLVLGFNVLSRFSWALDFKAADPPTWDARPGKTAP
jgi:hypothetical protein